MMTNIKEQIIEMLFEPVDNTLMGWILLILIWLLFILLFGIISYAILAAINYWFMPVLEGYGQIVAMHYEPAHYTTTYVYNAATKTSMPVTVWHPNAWKIIIDIDGAQDDFYLSAKDYVKQKIGKRIPVSYTTGRLWKSISIKTATI